MSYFCLKNCCILGNFHKVSMNMFKSVSLKPLVEKKIFRCWKRNVFTRKDFIALGGYDQVGRALLSLTREGKLIRIGYGLYAKARKNRITGLPILLLKVALIRLQKKH